MHFSSSLSSDSTAYTLPVGARATERSASSFVTPDSSASDDFASVLSQVNEPSSQPDDQTNSSDEQDEEAEDEKNKKDTANRGPTADQIAAALALAQPSLNAPAATPPSPKSSGNGTTLSLANGQGRSIAQLLAEGKPVLEFQAGSNPGEVSGADAKQLAAQKAAPEIPSDNRSSPIKSTSEPDAETPAKAKNQVANNASAESKTSALPAAAVPAPDLLKKAGSLNPSVGPSGVTSPAALSAQKGQEKFADQSDRQKGSGDNASDPSGKNASLVFANKQLKDMKTGIGTIAASGVKPMLTDVRTTVSAALPADSAVAASSGSAAGTTSGAVSQTDSARSAASHAADLVHQIHEIGEGLWSVDRQSVEVNFNFGEKEHLSVRVEYKDGQVQATFNTDSADLRAAISHAWNSQNTSADPRSFRMADPVFNSSSSNSFSSGDRSKQAGTFPDAATSSFSRPRSSASAAVDAAAPSPRASLRPEIAGRLNVIV